MTQNHSKPHKGRTTKTVSLRRLIPVLIVISLCWGLLHHAGSKFLRPVAIRQIKHLTGAKTQLKSVHFRLNGSVRIDDILICLPAEQEYDNTILKAQKLYAHFSLTSILALKPRLRKLTIEDFVFNLLYDSDQRRWNISSFKIKKSPDTHQLPVFKAKRGILRCRSFSNGKTEEVLNLPIDAEFASAKNIKNTYTFRILTGRVPGASAKSLSGFWQTASPGSVKFAGAISALNIHPLKSLWNISDLTGHIEYDKSDIYLKRLSLQLGDKTRIAMNGQIKNYPAQGPFQIQAKVKDLFCTPVPHSNAFVYSQPLLEHCGGFVQKFFSRYTPNGWVDIALKASGSLSQLPDSSLTGQIICKDISVCYQKFPYTLEHIIGTIDFTEKTAVLNNLIGKHGDVNLAINGYSKNFGPRWDCQIQITSENMCLDDDLYKALKTRHKRLWFTLAPKGRAAIDYCYVRKPSASKKSTLAVELLGAEAIYQYFPYPLKNLTGRLLIEAGSITLSEVLSCYDGRRIALNGSVTASDSNRPTYDIFVEADNIPLDSTLRAALNSRQKRFYDNFDIAGCADARVEIFTSPTRQRRVGYIANVDIKGDFLKYHKFPLVLTHPSVNAVFTPDLIKLERLTGRYEDSRASLAGRIWPAGPQDSNIGYCLLFTADSLELDSNLADTGGLNLAGRLTALLPPGATKILEKLQPEGRVNVSAQLNKNAKDRCHAPKIVIDCLGNSIYPDQLGYPIRDIKGTLSIIAGDIIHFQNMTAALADQAQASPQAAFIKLSGNMSLHAGSPDSGQYCLSVDELKTEGKLFTQLKTNLFYDATEKCWSTKNLTANCYRGKVRGNIELRPTQNGLNYAVRLGFDNIDLQQFLSYQPDDRNSLPASLALQTKQVRNESYTTGRMSGSLSLTGLLGDDHHHIGRLKLHVTDMQVGKLSPLGKLLCVLKLTAPKDFAFDSMTVDSYIRQNRLFFREVNMQGQALALRGSGRMNIPGKIVDLDFTAQGPHLAAEVSLLQSLTDGLSPAVVRMKVTGSLYDPQIKTTTLPVIKDTLGLLGTKPQKKRK